jgi:hypothetical protein
LQIKLEQRVMQQNQTDGTQPERLRSLRSFWFHKFPEKFVRFRRALPELFSDSLFAG